MTSALSVRGLVRPGLGPLDLDVAACACLALMGPSGSGKSLCLRAIADLDPNDGDVSGGGLDRAAVPAPVWRRHIAYVPAESGWWAEDVAAHFADPAAARPLLAAFGLPEAALGWPVARLSTGERQRLALARSLAGTPAVLLLDEPTAALDETARDAVERVLADRLAAGAAVLLVTHDPAQARRLSARIVRIADGRLVGA